MLFKYLEYEASKRKTKVWISRYSSNGELVPSIESRDGSSNTWHCLMYFEKSGEHREDPFAKIVTCSDSRCNADSMLLPQLCP
jgi:hypothetical protein